MLSLQTITTVAPIRSAAALAQAHLRLDELLAVNAFDSPDEDLRDEAEVLTALIHYYEQRTRRPGEFDAALNEE